jgi:phosphoglycolate phosphatase
MLIILDLDGTLIDSEKCHFNSFVKAFERNGFKLNKKDKLKIKSVFGMSSESIINSIVKVNNKLLNKITNDVKKIAITEEIHNVKLINGSINFLKKNSKNNVLAIATNSSKDFTNVILKKLDLVNYFKLIITPNNTLRSKPDSDMINYILEKLNYKKKDCVLIGDSVFDMISAKNAKIKFIGVLSKSDYKDDLLKNSKTFIDLSKVKI